jgi:asparagine synthetase B (glutamine-hydrolysing)
MSGVPAVLGARPETAAPAPGEQPAFLLEATPERKEGAWTTVGDWSVVVRQSLFRPAPAFFEICRSRVCVLGRPILGEEMDSRKVAEAVSGPGTDDAMLATINGEFAILISPPDRDELRIVSCRFGYPTIFYSHAPDRLLIGATFADVWERLAALGRARVNPDAAFDYLSYKRVFGDKTLEASTRLLGSAQILRFDGSIARGRTYWRPEFRSKLAISRQESGKLLADAITTSLRRRTRDGLRYSLFLSGGMDTRLLLASFVRLGIAPTCFTINEWENREVQVAKEAAAIADAPHRFVPTPQGHYGRAFRRAARLTGGHYMPMCMFAGIQDGIAEHADVGFHGHGFDYFFQGMYLPRWNPKLGRHVLFLRFPAKVPHDVVGYFLDNISYAIKRARLADFCDSDVYAGQRDRLRGELEADAIEAAEVTESREDALEYLSFSNLARHYSCADHWGINTLVEQRTAAFDNDLHDLYQTLPTRLRFDARVQRAALAHLSPDLSRLIAANHRFPIGQSSARKTVSQLVDAGLRALGIRPAPGDDRFERMGLPFEHLLVHDWRPLVENLRDSDHIDAIGFLDRARLNAYLGARLEDGAFGDNQFVVGLLVLDQMIQQIAA